MVYNGNLINVIPLRFVQSGTYKVSPNKRTDKDSYADADGVLHRNVLPHLATKIEFNTIPLTMQHWEELMNTLNSVRVDDLERKYNLTYYDPEYCTYKTGTFYMPDFEYTIDIADGTDAYVDSVRFAFIEY